MSAKVSNDLKRPVGAAKPFPWRCRNCGQNEVFMTETPYVAEVRHDGRLYTVTIPQLAIPICRSCGEKVFTNKVDDQINEGLRSHLHLLTPEEIRAALKRVSMTQKEASARLGIAEETLSRWLNETQIQSRALDNLMRVFFAFPQVRTALPREGQDLQLGIADIGSLSSN